MANEKQTPDRTRPLACEQPSGDCCAASRREFVKIVGLHAAAALLPGREVMAGPFTTADLDGIIPIDKKLDPRWVESLTARGEPMVYRAVGELDHIGMPVGGIGAGQLYLGGDGRLWLWDIFGRGVELGGDYVHPPRPHSPLDQGFALNLEIGGKRQVRALDRRGFADIRFRGEYPMAHVEFRDPSVAVAVSLEAFSPFIPLDTEDSSLPATVMRYTVKNTSSMPVDGVLAGWMENAVCLFSRNDLPGLRRNRVVHQDGTRLLEAFAEEDPRKQNEASAPEVFEDFESAAYERWDVEGDAFGTQPATLGERFHEQAVTGVQGRRLADSFKNDGRPGAPGDASDRARGRLRSRPFTIHRRFLSLLIGGGNHPGETCVNLLIDGQVARTVTGRDSERLDWHNWDVRELEGRAARIEIVDRHGGGWGHILVDQIEFRDTPRLAANRSSKLSDQEDFGAMTLALLDAAEADVSGASVKGESLPDQLFDGAGFAPGGETQLPLGQRLVGALGRRFHLQPGQETTITFVIAWRFPNLVIPDEGLGRVGRHYASRFPSSNAVAAYVSTHLERLRAGTRLWLDTWYDSTLPYWLLDRALGNTSVLATSTCYRFASGRFWAYEGVRCCSGTCTHVWQYAHAPARLFPDLERNIHEIQDLGVAFHPETGFINMRGEGDARFAADGMAGVILRCYREHQMSADGGFLNRNWPRIKKAMQFMMAQDRDGDGLLEGEQHNTLDANWYGPVAWLSGLFLAALRAAEEMASEAGDAGFAREARDRFESGQASFVRELWGGEYFVNKPDPRHPEAINSGTGCLTDQVFGQSWAWQVNLGRVLPEDKTKAALRSLWKYNFTPDVGPFRERNTPGRWYAVAGDAGLIGCTFPRPDWDYARAGGNASQPGFVGYFNECQSGYEYEVAWHMVWEGLVPEGLAIAKAIDDRYHAARRNPWNEIECGDHYARSMAVYGVYLAACGFEYHGPKGHIGFAPRLSPDQFRAAFTAAECWGSFHQSVAGDEQQASIELKRGQLQIETIALGSRLQGPLRSVVVTVAGKPLACRHGLRDGKIQIALEAGVILKAGDQLEVRVH